jgi:hypothetical protein
LQNQVNNTEGSYTVRINYQQPTQAISFSTGSMAVPDVDKEDIATKTQNKLIPFLFLK